MERERESLWVGVVTVLVVFGVGLLVGRFLWGC